MASLLKLALKSLERVLERKPSRKSLGANREFSDCLLDASRADLADCITSRVLDRELVGWLFPSLREITSPLKASLD